MAVAFDGSSESHIGTTGSVNEASFSWTHTPSGIPNGILVFTFVNANADDALSVTYAGLALEAVPGGRAVDTIGAPGDCKAWFLHGVPSGSQTVVVTRNNNANEMYAVAVGFFSSQVMEAFGPVLLQEDGALAEQNVNDGPVGTDSIRVAGVNSGRPDPPPAGANSTAMQSIDFGTRTIATVKETLEGQGSRLVGFTDATADDRAAIHLAVREKLLGVHQVMSSHLRRE